MGAGVGCMGAGVGIHGGAWGRVWGRIEKRFAAEDAVADLNLQSSDSSTPAAALATTPHLFSTRSPVLPNPPTQPNPNLQPQTPTPTPLPKPNRRSATACCSSLRTTISPARSSTSPTRSWWRASGGSTERPGAALPVRVTQHRANSSGRAAGRAGGRRLGRTPPRCDPVPHGRVTGGPARVGLCGRPARSGTRPLLAVSGGGCFRSFGSFSRCDYPLPTPARHTRNPPFVSQLAKPFSLTAPRARLQSRALHVARTGCRGARVGAPRGCAVQTREPVGRAPRACVGGWGFPLLCFVCVRV